MDLTDVFEELPDPSAYSFPDYAIPQGDPVMPVAVTDDELHALLALYETFADVDPTGMDSNPFLANTTEFLQQTFGTPSYRPDEQLNEDVASMLNDFSEDLHGEGMGVVDATPKHHQTLYFFLISAKGYHMAPHIQFDPDPTAVETLYRIYQRVTEQDYYLKRPSTVLE
ncbi:hypothetical protein Hrd1104_03780 [Halorhabdus sp. CBA1104]|uniref:hypothetical protein n=1 Tax=Halorhabdus sp. CBA1104 TaxID=1380432 RepID=UPI0012B405A4|nr:hypothetical protein [Halorhabdus sp. CBA1104]QGN06502.1 hypothetical protein Hrd1104_03780 [Halorhabdus sp. CBA1104]